MTPTTVLRRGVLRRGVVGLATLLLSVGGLLAATVPAAADDAPKVLLLLDVSGSMNAGWTAGSPSSRPRRRR